MVNAARDLANYGTVGSHFVLSIVGALAIIAIFAPLTVRMYMRKA